MSGLPTRVGPRGPVVAAALFIALMAMTVFIACGPPDETIDRDRAEYAAKQYKRIALREQKKWVRVIGSGLVIQAWPLVTEKKPDKRRLESLGVKLEKFISLQGNGIWAIHMTVKRNARKNPKGEFKPFILAWYEKSKRRVAFHEKAVVPADIVKTYARERMAYTFTNGTRTDLRVDIYYNEEPLTARLKNTRTQLLR